MRAGPAPGRTPQSTGERARWRELPPRPLAGNLMLRVLEPADAGALAAAYQRNREHLGPWEPHRGEDFYTVAGQCMNISGKLALCTAGTEVPWVLCAGADIVGAFTITGIVRGPFLSANIGYWVDGEYTGRGIGSEALRCTIEAAQTELGLHRLQAATLVHNNRSVQMLQHAGFEEIGTAPSYLRIAGSWQDHRLFQRLLF